MVAAVFKFIGITLLVLVALVVLLLHFSAVVRLHVGADGYSFSVKYMGLTIFPRKKKESKKTDSDGSENPYGGGIEIDNEIADLDLEDDLDELDELHKSESSNGFSGEKQKSAQEAIDSESCLREDDVGDNSDNDEADEQAAEEASEQKSEGDPKSAVKPEDPKKDKKTKKSENSDGVQKRGGKLAKLKARYQMIHPYIPYTWKMFKKLLKAVRIRVDYLSLMISRDDAHEAAIYYGGLQSLVTGLLMTLDGMFTLKVKRCDINCGFAKNDFDGCADISVRVRPSTMIAICVCIVVNAAVIFVRQKLAARKKRTAGEAV